MAVKILAVSCPHSIPRPRLSYLITYRFSLWPPWPWLSLAMAMELPIIHTEAAATATGVLRACMVSATMARERLRLRLRLATATILPPTATATTTLVTLLAIITRERLMLSRAMDMVMPPATTIGVHRVFMAITMVTMARERLSQATVAITEAIMEE